MLNVVMLNVVMLNVIIMNVVMLNVAVLNVVMLNVVGPSTPIVESRKKNVFLKENFMNTVFIFASHWSKRVSELSPLIVESSHARSSSSRIILFSPLPTQCSTKESITVREEGSVHLTSTLS
jgi:hypothetical protein